MAAIIYVRTYGVEKDESGMFRELLTLAPDLLLIDDRCLATPEPEAEAVDPEGAHVVLYSTGYSKFVDLKWGGFAHLFGEVPYANCFREFDPQDLAAITDLYKLAVHQRRPIYTQRNYHVVKTRLRTYHWLDTAPPDVDWALYRQRVLTARSKAAAQTERINAVYRQVVPADLQLPLGYHRWRFQIRTSDRDRLLKSIFAAGFFASAHYFPATTLFGDSPCPVATALANEVLNLFNDHRVTESDAEKVGRLISEGSRR